MGSKLITTEPKKIQIGLVFLRPPLTFAISLANYPPSRL
jgi:hypothetical protein